MAFKIETIGGDIGHKRWKRRRQFVVTTYLYTYLNRKEFFWRWRLRGKCSIWCLYFVRGGIRCVFDDKVRERKLLLVVDVFI